MLSKNRGQAEREASKGEEGEGGIALFSNMTRVDKLAMAFRHLDKDGSG